MGLLGGLIKTVINVATIPIDVAVDVATNIADDHGTNMLQDKGEQLRKNAQEIFDGDLL